MFQCIVGFGIFVVLEREMPPVEKKTYGKKATA